MTKKQIKDKNMKNNRPIIPDDESAYSKPFEADC